jgi:hypothetical protein
MGLTLAPGLPPLILSLKMPTTRNMGRVTQFYTVFITGVHLACWESGSPV